MNDAMDEEILAHQLRQFDAIFGVRAPASVVEKVETPARGGRIISAVMSDAAETRDYVA